jgi:ankyrin repeat protein
MKQLIPLMTLFLGASLTAMEKVQNQDVSNKDFIRAAHLCIIAAMKDLIREGADANTRDKEHGATALHWVIGSRLVNEEGQLRAIKFLLDSTDIDINQANNLGTTPLMWAIFSSKLKIAKFLLQYNDLHATVQKPGRKIDAAAVNDAGDSAMSYITVLLKASPDDKELLELRELLLENGAQKADAVTRPVYFERKDDGGLVSELLENGSKPYHQIRSALQTEGKAAALQVARDILQNEEDYVHWSAYHLAISQDQKALVEIMIEAGFEFDKRYISDRDRWGIGETPIELAKSYQATKIVELLTDYDTFADSLANISATPELVTEFVKKGYSLSFRTTAFNSALTLVIKSHRNLEVAKALVAAGAPVNESKSTYLLSPLALAVTEGAEDIACLLIKNKADITKLLHSEILTPKALATLMSCIQKVFGEKFK